ncbi:MAG: hypothetical protein J5I93_01360, partial [Pirellulaceae bacterium]|nr:hypothetical protein [Pirellulaceae bacterium]
TVDTTRTFHAFLAPEYRIFFYLLCGTALLVYCPVMMWIGYWRFLADRSARQNSASNGGTTSLLDNPGTTVGPPLPLETRGA